jgi:Domain of unknown function (DUF4340)
MRHLPVLLMALLGGQLALALSFALTGSDHAAFEAKEPLLGFAPAKIDRIAIDDDTGASVELDKQDGKWVIPSSAGFPADQTKVETFLNRLAALKKGWPIAKTDAAAERFKVTEKVHDRRVVLSSGGSKAGELLIGTSPSFRQVHARAGDASPIYAVEFAAYDAGADAETWMNHDVLDTPRDKIASIAVGEVTIEGKNGKFALAGLTKDDKPLPDKIDALASAVAHPAFDAVRGKGKDALAQADNPDLEVVLKRTDESLVTYRYKKDAAGGGYVFTSSAQDYLFRVADNKIAPIVQAKREALIEAPKPETKPNQASEAKPEQAPEAGTAPQIAPRGTENSSQASHGADPAKEHGG